MTEISDEKFLRMIHINNMQQKSLDKLFASNYYTLLKLQLESGEELSGWENDERAIMLKSMKSQIRQLSLGLKKKDCDKLYWLTINPDTETRWAGDHEELIGILMKKINQMKKWKNTSKMAWAFEQRGETPEEEYRGLHVHILYETNQTQDSYDLKRAIRNKFKSLWGDDAERAKTNYNWIKIIAIPDSWWEDKIRYLLGNKEVDPDEHKTKCCGVDIKMRESYNLENIYYFNVDVEILDENITPWSDTGSDKGWDRGESAIALPSEEAKTESEGKSGGFQEPESDARINTHIRFTD